MNGGTSSPAQKWDSEVVKKPVRDPIAALGGARSSPIYLICLVAARRPPGSRSARDDFFTTSHSQWLLPHGDMSKPSSAPTRITSDLRRRGLGLAAVFPILAARDQAQTARRYRLTERDSFATFQSGNGLGRI